MGEGRKAEGMGPGGKGRKGGSFYQELEQRERGPCRVREEIRDQRRKECQSHRIRLAGATDTQDCLRPRS